jgi:hypothetical protein
LLRVDLQGCKIVEIEKSLRASYPELSEVTLKEAVKQAEKDGFMIGRFINLPKGAKASRVPESPSPGFLYRKAK